jgi:hypothetical protein
MRHGVMVGPTSVLEREGGVGVVVRERAVGEVTKHLDERVRVGDRSAAPVVEGHHQKAKHAKNGGRNVPPGS